jgi:hypothetical protein
MRDAIELVRAIAWPLTVLIIFIILRAELQRFAKNMADRIQSANTITIGPKGFELKGLAKVVPVTAEVQARKLAIARYLRNLADKPLLDNIADVVAVPRSTDIRSQRNDIIAEVNRRVETQTDMDQLSTALKPVTARDF